MAKSYDKLNRLYDRKALTLPLAEEVVWGADYLPRSLSPQGFFYSKVSTDDTSENQRLIAHYDDINEEFTDKYQVSFRGGAGTAIAALARVHELSNNTGVQGEFSAKQYLADAERAFAHLEKFNVRYLRDGKENIIDDYTALIAATELYRITKN
jgi:hypothetical protein